MLTFVIADLHGRYDLLLSAWAEIQYQAGLYHSSKKTLTSDRRQRLIILGDFVDRGPQSREIIEFLMQGPHDNNNQPLPNWEWIILQGNHEAMMVMGLVDKNPNVLSLWVTHNGGTSTLKSYGYQNGDLVLPSKVPQTHLDWMKALPLTYEDEKHIYVHAGVPYDKTVENTSPEVLQWMIYSGEDTEDLEPGQVLLQPDITHISGKHIVHGHHQKALGPILLPHRTNLDAHAYYTGRLVIGVFLSNQPLPQEILTVKQPGMY